MPRLIKKKDSQRLQGREGQDAAEDSCSISAKYLLPDADLLKSGKLSAVTEVWEGETVQGEGARPDDAAAVVKKRLLLMSGKLPALTPRSAQDDQANTPALPDASDPLLARIGGKGRDVDVVEMQTGIGIPGLRERLPGGGDAASQLGQRYSVELGEEGSGRGGSDFRRRLSPAAAAAATEGNRTSSTRTISSHHHRVAFSDAKKAMSDRLSGNAGQRLQARPESISRRFYDRQEKESFSKMKILALNESSSEESESEVEMEISKEAQEAEAYSLYNKALDLQRAGSNDAAESTYQQLLGIPLLAEVEPPEDDRTMRKPGLMLKYLTYKNLGSMAYQKKDLNTAMERYLEAVAFDETDVTVWYRIGTMAVTLYRLPLARLSFTQALQCSPKHWPSLDTLCTVLYALNDYAGCLFYVCQALERDRKYIKGVVLREKMFKEQPSLRKDSYDLFKNCQDAIRPSQIDRSEAQKIIKEALSLREERCALGRREPRPLVKFLTPFPSFASFTWKGLGERLVALYDHLVNSSPPLSLCCKIDMSEFIQHPDEREPKALESDETPVTTVDALQETPMDTTEDTSPDNTQGRFCSSTESKDVSGVEHAQSFGDDEEPRSQKSQQQSPQQTPPETLPRTPQQTMEPAPQQTQQETPQHTSQTTQPQTREQTPQQTTLETLQEMPQETPENTPLDIPQQTPQQTQQQSSQQSQVQTSQQSQVQTSQQSQEQTSQQSQGKTSQQSQEQTSQQSQEQTSQRSQEQTSQRSQEQTSQQSKEQTSQQSQEQTSQQTQEQTSQQTQEQTSQQSQEQTSQQSQEQTSQQSQEQTSQQSQEQTSQQSQEQTSQQSQEQTSQQTQEQTPRESSDIEDSVAMETEPVPVKTKVRRGPKRKREKAINPVPGNRRSTRVRNTVGKKKEESVNYEEILRQFLPSSLQDSGVEDESDDAERRSLGKTEANQQQMRTSNRTENADQDRPIESVESDTDQSENVWRFLAKRQRNSGIIQVLDEYLRELVTRLQGTWPAGLTSVFLQANSRSRQHFILPNIFSSDYGSDFKTSIGYVMLTFAELKLDLLISAGKGTPSGTTKKADPEAMGKFIDEDLSYLQMLTNSGAIPEVKWRDFIVRVHWLKARYMTLVGRSEDAISSFDECTDILSEPRSDSNDKERVIVLPNCKVDNRITVDLIKEQLKSTQHSQSLEEVQRFYDAGSYERVTSLLLPTLQESTQSRRRLLKEGATPQRPSQLLLLHRSLLKLNDYKQCVICGAVGICEALQEVAVAKTQPLRDEWIDVTVELFTIFDKALCEDVGSLKQLERPLRVRLTSAIISVVQQCMDTESNFPQDVLPWVILYRLIKHEEDQLATMATQDGGGSPSTPMIPSSLMLLDTAHDYLGRRSWCCNSNGAFLRLYISVLSREIAMGTEEEPHPFLSDLQYSLEQCFFCLHGHPSKKTKARHLQDHGVEELPMDLEDARLIFDYFKPSVLPEFDSYKTSSMSGDLESLLLRIVRIVPPMDDPPVTMETLQAYVEAKTDVAPSIPEDRPIVRPVVKEIYYLLADFYFKNKELFKAIKLYMQDLCVCPNRLDSWAGMALARSGRLELKFNMCDSKTEGTIYKHSVAALRCFQRALEIDQANRSLWIEYGSMAYMVHSYASRQLKQRDQFSLTEDIVEFLQEKRSECLGLAEKCFEAARQCEVDGEEEEWLVHYMLGKVAEKQQTNPQKFLEHYKKAAFYLYEDEAKYPKKIAYHNPPDLSLEALEMYFRLHASILKLLEKPEVSFHGDYAVLQHYVTDAVDEPFVSAMEKMDTSEPLSSTDNEPDIKSPVPGVKVQLEDKGQFDARCQEVRPEKRKVPGSPLFIATPTDHDYVRSRGRKRQLVLTTTDSKSEFPALHHDGHASGTLNLQSRGKDAAVSGPKSAAALLKSFAKIHTDIQEQPPGKRRHVEEDLAGQETSGPDHVGQTTEQLVDSGTGKRTSPKAGDQQKIHMDIQEQSPGKKRHVGDLAGRDPSGPDVRLIEPQADPETDKRPSPKNPYHQQESESRECADGKLTLATGEGNWSETENSAGQDLKVSADVKPRADDGGSSDVEEKASSKRQQFATSGEAEGKDAVAQTNSELDMNTSIIVISSEESEDQMDSEYTTKTTKRMIAEANDLPAAADSEAREAAATKRTNVATKEIATQASEESVGNVSIITISSEDFEDPIGFKEIEDVVGDGSKTDAKEVAKTFENLGEESTTKNATERNREDDLKRDAKTAEVRGEQVDDLPTAKESGQNLGDGSELDEKMVAYVEPDERQEAGGIKDDEKASDEGRPEDKRKKMLASCGRSPVERRAWLMERCLEAMKLCLSRFPQHYKSLYRMANVYALSETAQGLRWSRDLLLGSNLPWQHTAHMPSPGLFAEHWKTKNLFHGVWRIPISEIDRSGSFPWHMYRSVSLLIDVLRRLRDHVMLLQIAVKLNRTPELGKKFLRDVDRQFLARYCYETCVEVLDEEIELSKKEDKEHQQQTVLSAYRLVQTVQNKLQTDPSLATKLLCVAFKIFRNIQIGSDVAVLDQAVRFCLQHRLASKTPQTPTSQPEFLFSSP